MDFSLHRVVDFDKSIFVYYHNCYMDNHSTALKIPQAPCCSSSHLLPGPLAILFCLCSSDFSLVGWELVAFQTCVRHPGVVTHVTLPCLYTTSWMVSQWLLTSAIMNKMATNHACIITLFMHGVLCNLVRNYTTVSLCGQGHPAFVLAESEPSPCSAPLPAFGGGSCLDLTILVSHLLVPNDNWHWASFHMLI